MQTNINIVIDAERIAIAVSFHLEREGSSSSQRAFELFPPLVHELFEEAALPPDERIQLVTRHVSHGVKQLVQTRRETADGRGVRVDELGHRLSGAWPVITSETSRRRDARIRSHAPAAPTPYPWSRPIVAAIALVGFQRAVTSPSRTVSRGHRYAGILLALVRCRIVHGDHVLRHPSQEEKKRSERLGSSRHVAMDASKEAQIRQQVRLEEIATAWPQSRLRGVVTAVVLVGRPRATERTQSRGRDHHGEPGVVPHPT